MAHDRDYLTFCDEARDWLDDYALFVTLKARFGAKSWTQWPAPYRDRDPEVLAAWREQGANDIEFQRFVQHVFNRQWRALKRFCNQQGVHIIGDAPIYVQHDSADVWANRQCFKLDVQGEPTVVAGVPPDYFSATGQRWGNPVYDWRKLGEGGYVWWINRLRRNLELYDYVRLDHFRGFCAAWEIPGGEETAVNGEWVAVPGEDLFTALRRSFASLPIIAEDLGYITADVRRLMDQLGFPGMRILQFAFGDNMAVTQDAPHNYERNTVAYTGTHDNTTMLGWLRHEASPEARERFCAYGGCPVCDESQAHVMAVRLVMMSVAASVVFPMQDVLGLGPEARMNTPSVAKGNWEWRMLPGELDMERLRWLKDMTEFYGRAWRAEPWTAELPYA